MKMEKTIQEAVAEKITQGGESVANTVIEKLAELEITTRVDAITKAIQNQTQREKDLKKINKNDVITYIEGKPTEVMSKNRFEEIKKSKDKIAKLAKAIDVALTQNSFDAYKQLSETLKKLDNTGENKAQGSEDSE